MDETRPTINRNEASCGYPIGESNHYGCIELPWYTFYNRKMKNQNGWMNVGNLSNLSKPKTTPESSKLNRLPFLSSVRKTR